MKYINFNSLVLGFFLIAINAFAVQIGDQVLYMPNKGASRVVGKVVAVEPRVIVKLQSGDEITVEGGASIIDERSVIKIQRVYREHRRGMAAREFLLKKECGELYETMTSEILAKLAEDAFRASNYGAASFFSGQHSKKLEIRTNGKFKYRFLTGFDGGVPEQDENFVYLYKVVKKSQLPVIAMYGLDSNYGGRGGVSESYGMTKEYIVDRDRGRQFFAPQFKDVAVYAPILEKSSKEPSIILQVKLLHGQTLAHNLTQNMGNGTNEYFITGTTVHPESIRYLEDSVTTIQSNVRKAILLKEGLSEEEFSKLNWSNSDDAEKLTAIWDKFDAEMQETVPKLKFLPIR